MPVTNIRGGRSSKRCEVIYKRV